MSTINVKRLATLAIITSAALIAHYVEGQLPPLVAGVPIKLGLGNIFVLIALISFSPADAAAVAFIKCVAGTLLLGGAPTSFIFSLAGTVLSLTAMSLLKPVYRRELISPIGLSVAGAFCFNIGQLLAGIAMLGGAMLGYLPIMGLLSIPTGIFIGLVSYWVEKALRKINAAN